MFAIIFCFFPILFLIFQFYLLKKRKSLSWEIKKGHICYNCKEDLNISEKDVWDRLMKSEYFSRVCISCSRDRKIASLKNRLLVFKYKFQKVIVSKKFEKIHFVFLPIVFFFIILDVVLIFCGMKLGLWVVYGSLNIIWWLIVTYKTYYTSEKK